MNRSPSTMPTPPPAIAVRTISATPIAIATRPKVPTKSRYQFTRRPSAGKRVDWSFQTAAGEARGLTMTPQAASCCLRSRRDHHAAGRVLEHVVDGVAEDSAALPAHVAPGGAHDDDLAVAPRRLFDDRGAGAAGAHDPDDHVHAVGVAD